MWAKSFSKLCPICGQLFIFSFQQKHKDLCFFSDVFFKYNYGLKCWWKRIPAKQPTSIWKKIVVISPGGMNYQSLRPMVQLYQSPEASLHQFSDKKHWPSGRAPYLVATSTGRVDQDWPTKDKNGKIWKEPTSIQGEEHERGSLICFWPNAHVHYFCSWENWFISIFYTYEWWFHSHLSCSPRFFIGYSFLGQCLAPEV